MIVLDANVLIALLYPDDPHSNWANAICSKFESEHFLMSSLTLAECLVLPYRQSKGAEFEDFIAELDIQVESFLEQDASELALLRAETRLKTPDAVVLLTAARHQAPIITADKTLARAARERGLTAHVPD